MAGSQNSSESLKTTFDQESWICGVQYGIVCEDKPDDTPADDKPTDDKPADQVVEDKPADDKPADDKPADDGKPANDLKPEDSGDDWKTQRIAKLTARLRALEAAKPGAAADDKRAAGATDAEIEARIEAEAESRATSKAAQREFNNACNNAATAGRAAYPDFDGKIKALVSVVDATDPAALANYNTMLATAIETGKAHELIYALGSDLNEANRVLSLSPVKMALELAKMTQGEDKPVSGMAKPIRPIGSRGTTHEQIDPTDPDRADGLTTKQWMERREAQMEKRRA